MNKFIFSLSIVMFSGLLSYSQVIVNEGFDYATGMPSQQLSFGWEQAKILPSVDPENVWLRTNTSVYAPIHGTYAGAGMLRYRSYDIDPGEAAMVISRPFDLSARPLATSSTLSFWLYRENTWTTNYDSVSVWVNTAPNLTGAINLLESSGFYQIPRYIGFAPVVATNGWYQYTFTIPAGAPWSSSNLYVMIKGTSRDGNDIFVDEFSIQTYPANQNWTSYGLVLQNTTNVGISSTNNWIVCANIVMSGENQPYTVNSLVFNLLGMTTNYNGDIASARLFWTGGTSIFDINFSQQIGTTVNNPFGSSNVTFNPVASFRMHNGNNYFWLVYNITAGATSGNYVDGEFVSFQVSGGAANNGNQTAPSPATLPGGREIDLPYCIPVYTVGTAWAGYTNNDYINHVILNGETGYPVINNNLNSAGPNIPPWFGGPCPFSAHPPDYERFPAVPGKTTVLKVSTAYTLQAQVGTYFSGNCLAAWIDYNRDGDFYDAGEKLGQTPYPPGLPNLGWWNQPFTVPASPVLGTTTLRVRETWINNNIDPCLTYVYGETEDYSITLIPDCNILPGWRVWLGGFDNDWNNPLNWCGGVPTIGSDAAILPDIDIITPGNQGPAFQPIVYSGVNATTRKFRIEGPDSLTCDAYLTGSFTAADSVTIMNNSSYWRVKSNLRDSVKMYLGTLNNSSVQPMTQATVGFRQRSTTVFTAAEMYAAGLRDGDIIDTITLTFTSRATNQPYSGFTVSYYYTTPGWTTILTPTAWPPVVASGGVVFNTPVNLSAPGPFFVPASGGKLYLPLTPPIIFNPAGNDFVIEICYSNATAAGLADAMVGTQLIGIRKYMRVAAVNTSAPAGCSLMPGDPNTQRTGTDVRPNIQFHWRRNYQKFPIQVGNNSGAGRWYNGGTFIAGRSVVRFQGIAEQPINGPSITTFCDLTVNNNGHVRMDQSANVDSVLTLQTGRLRLNSQLLTLNYGVSGALVRVSGFLQSENLPPNYGRIRWNMGANTGLRTFPFVTAGGVYIPFTYLPTGGTTDLTVATYPTNPANIPWPTGVTNINNFYTQTDNSANMVDRFWILNNAGVNPQADITFSFAPAESAGAGTYWSQRYDPILGWREHTPGQSFNVATLTNTSPALVAHNTPWALTLNTQPLPVELLSFKAIPEGKRVKLQWVTASELNNDHFVIERTTDGNNFTFIGTKKSLGSGSSTRVYTLYDNNPLAGLQYYRLTEVDVNGLRHSHPLVAVNISKEINIIGVVDNSENSFSILFNYNSDLPFSYKLIDVSGRIISSGDGIPATEGLNTLEINQEVAAGLYTIIINNTTDVVSRKFVR